VEILNNVNNSIASYFNALKNFGYKKYSDVNKLLAYIFISEVLTGDMRIYITEEDYNSINKALRCLYGTSCLIPYPKLKCNNDTIHSIFINPFRLGVRITQDGNIRFTEGSSIKITEDLKEQEE